MSWLICSLSSLLCRCSVHQTHLAAGISTHRNSHLNLCCEQKQIVDWLVKIDPLLYTRFWLMVQFRTSNGDIAVMHQEFSILGPSVHYEDTAVLHQIIVQDCCSRLWYLCYIMFNMLRLRQNGHHFADDILKFIFFHKNCCVSVFTKSISIH